MIVNRNKKKIVQCRFSKALKVYKLKDFEKVLASEGFYYHHKNSSHNVYANSEYYFVTVPRGNKQLNAMMTTVTLQRIHNHQCRKLDVNTINRYRK